MVEAAATSAAAARVRSHHRRMRVRNAFGRERGREPTLPASEGLEQRPFAGRKRDRERHPDFLPARRPRRFENLQGGSPGFEGFADRRLPRPDPCRRPSLHGHLLYQQRCGRRSLRLRLPRQCGSVSNIRLWTGSVYRAGVRIGGRRRFQSCGDQVEMGRYAQGPLRRGAGPPVRPVKRRLLTERTIGACRVAASREGDMMLNGIVVLVLAIAVLAAIWAVILYGSTYFGPR